LELYQLEAVVELLDLRQVEVVDLEVDRQEVLLDLEQKVVVIHHRLVRHKEIQVEVVVAPVVEPEVEPVERVEMDLDPLEDQEEQECLTQ
tara:strand:+ start:236 stop:505 length:270 start_codon:yes stop_codon:yes gene_type:complete